MTADPPDVGDRTGGEGPQNRGDRTPNGGGVPARQRSEGAYLDAVRAQLQSVDDHCETARDRLTDLRDDLNASDETARAAIGRERSQTPTLAAACGAIRENTFDALYRQLSKLLVADPDAGDDALSRSLADECVTELYQHHGRLMEAVDVLGASSRTDPPDLPAARQAVARALQAIEHVESTTDHVRCRLEKTPVRAAAPAAANGPDESTAEYVVEGAVAQAGDPVGGVTVRAFDVDLSGEEPLGEASADDGGAYRIAYTEEDFARAERGTADVTVRAFDVAGRRLAASEVRYNVGRRATIDVAIPDEVRVEPTTYARLRAELDPLLGGRSVRDLDDSGVAFLRAELELADRAVYPAGEATLDGLVTAAGLAEQTPFAERVLFALVGSVESLDRASLASADPATLADAVRTAVEANVVRVPLDGLTDRLSRKVDALARARRLESGTERRATVRITSPEGDPVSRFPVAVQDSEDGHARRVFRTDRRGRITVPYTSLDGESRAFDLTVLNDAGTTLHEESVTLDGGQTEIAGVEPTRGFSGSVPVNALDLGGTLTIPGGVSGETLGAVRRAGGAAASDGAVSADDAAVADDLASMDLLTDPSISGALLARGFENQGTIAETPLSDFQITMHDALDPEAALRLHQTAQAQTYALDSLLVDRLARLRNGHAPEPGASTGRRGRRGLATEGSPTGGGTSGDDGGKSDGW